MDDEKLLCKEECYAIQGAVFEVYREMGCGFLEHVYQECLDKEFRRRSIPFAYKPELKLTYKGEMLEQTYKPDFDCFEKVILELKSVRGLAPEHQAQVINYLKATRLRVGLLVNFGSYPKVAIQRLVL